MYRMFVKYAWLLALLPFCLTSKTAKADWTLNLGYHNPVYSHVGVNFLYWGSQWNFELGIGWIDGKAQEAEDKDNNGTNEKGNKVSAAAAGDINLKYRFFTGTFSPYIQGGFGASTYAEVGDDNGADANLGGPFVGAGFFIGQKSFHIYVAGNYLVDPKTTQIQGGIGFDI